MNPRRLTLASVAFAVSLASVIITHNAYTPAKASEKTPPIQLEQDCYSVETSNVDVVVNGRPLQKYVARGKMYVEAIDGADYELRIRNPLSQRVAVALSVDGLNTIDARHSSAWNASKWVIEPYETLTISGWQMSSRRARHFYFTGERDSYGAKLGQTANLGVITAVFYKERQRPPRPIMRSDGAQNTPEARESDKQTNSGAAGVAQQREVMPKRNDDYAATGIGRSVDNDVVWTTMDLEPQPVSSDAIRYEFYSGLLRLGIIPRQRPDVDPLRRREQSEGFEERRFSPEP
ncbi:MAG: hypothetical protein ABR555_15550 [Pyrinomonadaceae bacterium]